MNSFYFVVQEDFVHAFVGQFESSFPTDSCFNCLFQQLAESRENKEQDTEKARGLVKCY